MYIMLIQLAGFVPRNDFKFVNGMMLFKNYGMKQDFTFYIVLTDIFQLKTVANIDN